MEEPQEVRGDADLGTLEWSQKQARLSIDVFGDEMLLLAFQLDGTRNDWHGDLQQGRRGLNQLLLVDGTVPIVGKFLEDMPDAGLSTDHRVPRDPESLRQRISGLEANAV